MTTRFVISIILLVVSGSSSWATASTARSRTTGLFCQGGSDFGQNDYIDCRLDSYNAQNALFMSRRQRYERLFLGGDAYSAPMVLQKSGNGSWTPYVIGRDYLGSITNIVTTSGTVVAEYSYDAWGRLRDPQTLTPYASSSQPSLMLGRGYCGHEHLSNFGLINMNARLYDPVLGRFLSPDPYVQAPDFSQSFNRYTYALNNPLKYTDESGEYTGIDDLLAALIGGTVNWATNGCQFTWAGLSYFAIGATSGVASLYLSPVVTAGLTGAANSIVKQGFGNDGKWDGKRISLSSVFFDGAMSAAFSYAGSELSSLFSPFFSKLTSGISGKAWSGMLSQGLTSGGTGFLTGFTLSAITQYKNNENHVVSWEEALISGRNAALMGLAVGSISGMAQGVIEAKAVGENPWGANDGQYSVYVGRDSGSNTVRYVGITKREPQIRWAEHARSGTARADLDYSVLYSGLSRMDARVMEQILINQFGLNNLYNKINSISPSFWAQYGIKP